MTLEMGLALGGFAVTVAGVLVNALWLMRKVTQSESEIKNSIASVQTSITHHNEVTKMRFDNLDHRVQGVEGAFKSITKVVVFPEGRET
jgi:protein subunit release factor A